MSPKGKIKVIKKGEVANPVKPAFVEKRTKQEAAREMVSTVTNWVGEFQHRRREETKQAFENLFASQAQIKGV